MTIRKLLNYWLGKKRSGFYLWMGILAAGMYVTGLMIRSEQTAGLSVLLQRFGFVLFLVVVTALFIHLNLHANHWFLDHFRDTDHLPVKQIAHVNSFCMTLFLCLTLVILTGGAYALDPLWQMIGRWLTSYKVPKQPVDLSFEMHHEHMDSPDLSALLGEPKPTPKWMLMLDEVLRILVVLLLILLAVFALRRLLRHIWSWITKPRQFDSDEKIYLTPSWSLPSGEKSFEQRKKVRIFSSYDEKIRRQYRRRILSLSRKKKISPAPSSSPTELEEAVGLRQLTIHQLYEKARYSYEECTKEEWERVSRE